MRNFNLNNEMIDMRKDIKRAKIRTITKLIRRIRNLRNKKGTESQLNRNTGRAERLLEELDMIKEFKSDEVFKMLLNSHIKLTAENLMRPDLSPKQRAIIRVGSTSFIQERMSNIREKVSGFHHARSERSLPAVFNVIEKAIEKQDGETQDAKTLSSNKIIKHSTSNDKIITTSELADSSPTNKDNGTFLKNKKDSNRETNPQFEVNEQIELSCNKSKSDDKMVTEDGILGKSEHDQSSDGETNAQPPSEEIVIGTASEGYQIVIPVMPYTQNKTQEIYTNACRLHDVDGIEDVTEILPNVGENFHSEDESSDMESDIELEDLEQRKKQKDQETQEDLFFVDKKGSSSQKFLRSINKTANSADFSEAEAISQVKSCFVESLASVSHQRNRGKNRMSQRMRKQLHKKQSNERANNNAKGASESKEFSGKTMIKDKSTPKTTELKPMHPSWEASRKRKEQQSHITQFQGKRVCFDDSD